MEKRKKRQRDEAPEMNYKKMRYPCMSCRIKNGDDEKDIRHWKPYNEFFDTTKPEELNEKLLKQGAWARCLSCEAEIKKVNSDKARAAGGEKGGGLVPCNRAVMVVSSDGSVLWWWVRLCYGVIG